MTAFTLRSRLRALLGLGLFPLALFACAGSQPVIAMPKTPAPQTEAALVGPLCEGGTCACSDTPSDLGAVPEGKKRFQILLGPSQNELWARVAGNAFYKSLETASSCFVVDLEPGEHAISMHAKGRGGFGARMLIRELGGDAPWLYESFEFSCGAPGLCDRQSLNLWKEQVARVKAGKHAPCGSVRILNIDWVKGTMPDNLHPEEFHLSATMKVYKFQPKYAPKRSECIKE